LLLSRGTGAMIVNTTPDSIDATIDSAKNTITLTTKNVDSMRIYLNDQMVDLSKPVQVIVNRRPRVEQIVKTSIDEMLRDQLFLGRGWRYYSAVIDIDYAPAPAA